MEQNKRSNIFIWQGAWKGGAEKVTHDLASYLRTHTNHTVVLGVYQGEERADIPFEQIAIPRILPKQFVAYNNILASVFARKHLSNFDLVLSHSAGFWQTKNTSFAYREPGDLLALFWSLPVKSKLLYFPALLMAIISVRRARVPIAASKKAELFFSHIGCKHFLSTSNFLSDTSLPQPLQKKHVHKDPFVILFVGRDDRIKNLALLKEAVEELSEHNFVLHIFGQEGLNTKQIHYHGWQTEQEIYQFMNEEAQVFVLPSLFEASPLTLLSALALGTPSLASSGALPAEYAKYTTSFSTKKELKDALLSLAENFDATARRAYLNSYPVRKDFELNTVLSKEFEALFSRIEKKDQKTP